MSGPFRRTPRSREFSIPPLARSRGLFIFKGTRDETMDGKVKAVKADRGFGFITITGTREDVFFHYRDLPSDVEMTEELIGRHVSFDVTGGAKGARANNVRFVDEVTR